MYKSYILLDRKTKEIKGVICSTYEPSCITINDQVYMDEVSLVNLIAARELLDEIIKVGGSAKIYLESQRTEPVTDFSEVADVINKLNLK